MRGRGGEGKWGGLLQITNTINFKLDLIPKGLFSGEGGGQLQLIIRYTVFVPKTAATVH